MTPRPPALLSIVAAAMLLGGSARAASADAGTGSVVLAAGDPAMLDQVRATAAQWLGTHGWTVSDGGLKKKDAAKLSDCLISTPDGCTDPIAHVGTDRLWFFMVESHPGDAGADSTITLRVFARDGTLLASDQRYCERCRKASLSAQVEKVLGIVAEAATARTAARTVLKVQSDPPGALVEIDGKKIGTTNPEVEYAVLPGSHRLVVTLDGYETSTRSVDLQDGEEKPVLVTLSPKAHVAPLPRTTTPTTRRHPGLWPYLLGGVGIAAVGSGVALMAINEPTRRDGELQYHSRESLVPGAILAGAGAVALGVGVYLYFHAPKEKDSPTLLPTASVSASGVSLGIQGAF